ncbi:unnamed protein product [Discula destructiva]
MAPKQVRILCLGASLVAGYSCLGAVYHPFSHNLLKMLRMLMPQIDFEIEVDGLPGDRVTTGRFIERMKGHFREGKEPYDWTICLGGTNDIPCLLEVDEIMNAMKETWAIPLAHGSKVLAVTVPRATVDQGNQRLVDRRNALNQRIKTYGADGYHVFDLHEVLPYDSAHARYWDDAIHFTVDGYDFIGDKIGVFLAGLMLKGTTPIAL